jgi:hypothetical protein
VFDAVLTPGDIILLATWKTKPDAKALERKASMEDGARLRRITGVNLRKGHNPTREPA